MADEEVYTVRVRSEDGSLWAEVLELPGCFASGEDWDELREAVQEAIALYLSGPDRPVKAAVTDWEHPDDRVTVLVAA
jgi:predicted RNase H-like HicB family nuclease